MPNVLSFNAGSDPAGISSGIARAFRADPEWSVRSLVSMYNYIGYAMDLEWNRRTIAEHWDRADVVHLHHGFNSFDRVRSGYLGQRLRAKPFVVHHHGTGFRESAEEHIGEAKRRGVTELLVSTLDLYLLDPEALEWLPSPIDVESLRTMKQPPSDTVRIVHAPTNRQVKSTREFLEAVERLQAEGYPVELDLIERVSWTECMARKAKADIFFDQVILGYGNNALEAWAMGIPVVAGAADETLDEMERRFGHLPFYHATEETIYDALKELVESPELRERYGRIGYEYVKRFHDYPVVVEQLKALYTRAIQGTERKAAWHSH